MTEFSEHLKQIRKARGFTQKDVAAAIEITERNYQCYESGSRGREFESRHSDQIGLDFPSKIKTFLLQKNFAPSGLPFNLLPNLLPDLLPPPITPIRRRS